jgi:hypothetical protein
VILCCLEGLSQEEAARRLGCTPGSIKGRLERGRRRLRDRLARRGIALAAALGVVEVSRCVAPASVPAGLPERSAAAACAGAASPAARALAEGVLQAMKMTTLKGILAAVLAVGLLGLGTGALAFRLGGGGLPAPKQAAQPPKNKASAPEQPKANVPAAPGKDAARALAARVNLLRDDLAVAWEDYRELEDQLTAELTGPRELAGEAEASLRALERVDAAERAREGQAIRDTEQLLAKLVGGGEAPGKQLQQRLLKLQDNAKAQQAGRAIELIRARRGLVLQQARVRRVEREQALQREIAEARVREAAERLRRAESRLRGAETAPQEGRDLRRELEALRRELRELRRALERQGQGKGRAP